MEINSRQVLRRILPEARIIGSSSAVLPLEKGLVFGVYIQRLRDQSNYTRITRYVKFALAMYEPQMRLSEPIYRGQFDIWQNEELMTSLDHMKKDIQDYILRTGSCKQCSEKSHAYFERYPNMNSLYEVAAAHYLDKGCRLPQFSLSEDEIFRVLKPTKQFEFDQLRDILQLQSEWNSLTYDFARNARILTWLKDAKLPETFFDSVK